jgi:hypothetical protein
MQTKHIIFPWELKNMEKNKIAKYLLRKIKKISIKTEYCIFPWELTTRKINPPIPNFLTLEMGLLVLSYVDFIANARLRDRI